MVQNTVAHLQNANRSFTLTGRSVAEVLRFVLGFLAEQRLAGSESQGLHRWSAEPARGNPALFSWHPHLTLLLDWFHVVKKFKEDLSLACKGREIRNRHLKQLLTLLWFGLIDPAQAYLAAIPATDLKDDQAITGSLLTWNATAHGFRAMPCAASWGCRIPAIQRNGATTW